MYTPTSPPLFFFFSPPLRKAIPREQEIWNYNSGGDKWYVALLWIINESRRALVLPSCLSVIQTVWREQDMLAKQVGIHTLIHTQDCCVCHRFQHFRSSGSFTVLDVFRLSKLSVLQALMIITAHVTSPGGPDSVWFIILRGTDVTQQQLIPWLRCDVMGSF